MKRMIHSLLAAAVLVSAMTCTAFAATTDYSVDKGSDPSEKTMTAPYVGEIVPSADGKSFTVSYDGAKSGEQYVLLIVKLKDNGEYNNPAEPGNITYINQDEAKEGKITFSNFIPMTSANAAVLLGGVFDGDSPVVLGELKVPYVLGNVNGDYDKDDNPIINSTDAMMILQHSVKMLTLDSTAQLAANVNGDVDKNGDPVINSTDAMMILQYSVKMIDKFPAS